MVSPFWPPGTWRGRSDVQPGSKTASGVGGGFFLSPLTAGRGRGILPYMEEQLTLQVVARIRSYFTSKVGIPRQSNLVPEQEALVVFEPQYRDENALRGLEGYSHLWLIWGFSEVHQEGWSPMVKPPKLGGNKRMGKRILYKLHLIPVADAKLSSKVTEKIR